MTTESKLPTLLLLMLMLMGVVILLMVAIIGLFIRVNRLQEVVLAAPPPGATVEDVGLEVGTPAPAFILTDVGGAPVEPIKACEMAGSELPAISYGGSLKRSYREAIHTCTQRTCYGVRVGCLRWPSYTDAT